MTTAVLDRPGSETIALDASAQDLLFREARTASTFADEPVSEDQLRAIYDLVKFAPTAMNGQPLRIVAVRSAQARARLVEHMAPGNQAKTQAAPLVVVLAADLDFHDELPTVFPHAPGARDRFVDDPKRAEVARFNGALQVGYVILGVRAAGLAVGPMTGFDAAAIERTFFPDGRHAVLAVLNIGRPAGGAAHDRLPRLDYDQVVRAV